VNGEEQPMAVGISCEPVMAAETHREILQPLGIEAPARRQLSPDPLVSKVIRPGEHAGKLPRSELPDQSLMGAHGACGASPASL
jgi:hypothetical protein